MWFFIIDYLSFKELFMNTFIRKIDSANRLKIPKEIIELLAIKKGDSIEIFIENENLILRKFNKEMRI